jgi:organic radical activating enzyme
MTNYKKFKIERLDPISSSFCASKWMQPNFYLYAGTTSSCQLPEPDKIDLNKVKEDIKYIDSTVEKIKQREMMLAGQRPHKCANCWHIENENINDPNAISERILYSYNSKDYDFTKFTADDAPAPRTITVAFDTLCNFSCSYCDPSQSSSWYTDIKINGPFKGICGDSRNTYQRLGKNHSLNEDEYRFLFEKFCEYTVQKIPTLEAITCLGGEPLISPNFWAFIEKLSKVDTSHVILTVITNLSSTENVKKILKLKNKFKQICIFASIENVGSKAEFLRNGLIWNQFEDNLNFLVNNDIKVRLLATVSGIAIDGLVEFLEWYKNLADKVELEIYRLRHPNFQAPQILPKELKEFYALEISKWLSDNEDKLAQFTVEQVKNIVTVLKNESIIFNNIDISVLQQSARAFYIEYARRNSFNIKEIYREQIANWILNQGDYHGKTI